MSETNWKSIAAELAEALGYMLIEQEREGFDENDFEDIRTAKQALATYRKAIGDNG